MVMEMLPPQSVSEQTVSRSRPVPAVAKLAGLLTPDLLVTSRAPLTAEQVTALNGIKAMKGLTVVSTGTAQVGAQRLAAMGVDASGFRPFTPRETASSDALWRAVAAGEVASSYAARLPLSTDIDVNGVPLRVGALASFGLPGANVVVSRTVGEQLGLRTDSVLLTAPDRLIKTLKRDIKKILGDDAVFQVLRPVDITYRRPATYEELYRLSAQYCPGLSWKVLAAIGQVESGHGRNVGPSTAGALGPMQFLPTTWAEAGVDGDGDGTADIMSPYDAVPAAALYLCRNGAAAGGQGLYNAIFSYNHADWYVKKVLDLAARYG